VAAGQRSEFRRERKGHHEVRHRQQETVLVFQPLFSLVLLALGTVPVLTGVVAIPIRMAGLTVIDLAPEGRRAAALNVLHGSQMTRRHPVAKWCAVPGAMEAEHLRALHHHRSPMRRLMASAPRCSALAVRCV
jgi:hypothetical protein